MNTQMRYTSVDGGENRLHMQALQQQAAQDALAQPEREDAPRHSFRTAAGHTLHAAGHGLWVAMDELALELADMLHGHRPHRHHPAH